MKKLLLALALLASPLAAQFNYPARAKTTAPAWAEGQYVLLSVDLAGNLRVTCVSGCGGGPGGNPTGGWLDSLLRVKLIDTLTHVKEIEMINQPVDAQITSWLGSVAPTVGQKLMAASLPVTMASDQSTMAVTLTGVPSVIIDDPLVTGGNCAGTCLQVRLDSLTYDGQKTMAQSFPVVVASDQSAIKGADSVFSWFGSTAPTVGQKTMANSLPVVVASDQSTLNVNCASGCSATPALVYDGVYQFTHVDVAGVAAAQNFVCLFMTSGVNDTVDVLEVTVEAYSNVAAATNNSLTLTRVTTCTVGTLQAAAAIAKNETAHPNAGAEVRTANPTVTAGANITGWGVSHAITAASPHGTSRRTWKPNSGVFRLLSSEGIVVRQTVAGDTDQRFTITIVWGERQ